MRVRVPLSAPDDRQLERPLRGGCGTQPDGAGPLDDDAELVGDALLGDGAGRLGEEEPVALPGDGDALPGEGEDAPAEAEGSGDGPPVDGDTVLGEDAGTGSLGDGDGDADGDGDGDGVPVTVQLKLTEPVPPDGVVAVMVTACSPVPAAVMVPVIRPLPLIDRPPGRPAAVNAGGCPAAALSEPTCRRIAVPASASCAPGSSSRTMARPK